MKEEYKEPPKTEQKKYQRTRAENEIDYNMIVTDPQWGKEVAPELLDKLKYYYQGQDSTGNKVITTEDLWGLLSFYTRDVRLSNLDRYNNEFGYCQYYLDLAGDCLRAGYIRSFLASLSRVITVLELAQSKGGFLRRRQGTVTSENLNENKEPVKRGLFGRTKTGE
jgi:hypothetical protein